MLSQSLQHTSIQNSKCGHIICLYATVSNIVTWEAKQYHLYTWPSQNNSQIHTLQILLAVPHFGTKKLVIMAHQAEEILHYFLSFLLRIIFSNLLFSMQTSSQDMSPAGHSVETFQTNVHPLQSRLGQFPESTLQFSRSEQLRHAFFSSLFCIPLFFYSRFASGLSPLLLSDYLSVAGTTSYSHNH